MEIWKDIIGYENLYQISNLGRVKSKHKFVQHKINGLQEWPERIINYNINNNKYYAIRLSKNSIIQRYLVHRLVALHFINNDLNKSDVNHKDGNKANNCASNLEWVTKSENTRHAIQNNLRNHNHLKKEISLIKDGIIYKFNSFKEAGKTLNISNLSRLYNGSYKQINGYKLYK